MSSNNKCLTGPAVINEILFIVGVDIRYLPIIANFKVYLISVHSVACIPFGNNTQSVSDLENKIPRDSLCIQTESAHSLTKNKNLILYLIKIP